MKKFIITEEEKKNILSMYSILTEENGGEKKLDVSKYAGKTYKLYLESGGKSTKFEWMIDSTPPHPKPVEFLPNGKDYFEVKIKGIIYYSGYTELNYQIICEPIINSVEKYAFSEMSTDSKMLENSKFKVTVNYASPPGKFKWAAEVFYGYSDELRTDLNNNGIK